MQMDEAARRRREHGDQPCDHSRYEKEYALGADTGDWACIDCGATWMRGTNPPGPKPQLATETEEQSPF